MDKAQFLSICTQMDLDPAEMSKLDEFKAFADTTVDDTATEEMLAELPPVGETPPVIEEVTVEAKTGIDALIDALDMVIKDEEAKKEDVKTAEELKGRLEELKAAEKNAQDFLDKVKKPEMVEDVKEEKAPGGGGAGTMEEEMTIPSTTA